MPETINTPAAPPLDVARELEHALKLWAGAQSPQTDFSGWRMFAFVAPVKVEGGQLFAPGELTLCRPARERAAEFVKVGLPPPLAAWSFARGAELLLNPALVSLETEPFPPAAVASPEPPQRAAA